MPTSINPNPEPNPGTAPDAESDEPKWEQPPSGVMDPIVSAPPPIDMSQIADDVSVLLELFSKTKPANNSDIGIEHKEMIDTALGGIMKRHRELRVLAAGRDGGGLEAEVNIGVDVTCIICYAEIVDTAILPCGHLVLFTVGWVLSEAVIVAVFCLMLTSG